jgi:hypothetical protein
VSASSRRGLALFVLFLMWPVALVETNGTLMTDSELLAAMRLVKRHTFTLSDQLDPKTIFLTTAFDIASFDNHVYSGVAPGATLLAAPIYAVAKPAFALFDDNVIGEGRIRSYYLRNSRLLGLPAADHFKEMYLLHLLLSWCVVAPLFAAFLVRLLWLLSEEGVPRAQGVAIAVAVGMGSIALYYCAMYSRQALAGLFAWHALLSLIGSRSQSPSRGRLLISGLLLGSAIAVDYPSALLVGLILVFRFPSLTMRERLLVAAPIGAVMALVGLYHQSLFGSPFSTPYSHRCWPTPSTPNPQTLDFSHFERGLYVGLNLPSLSVMLQLCFGPYKGLFVYSPILLLGLIGHLRGARDPQRRGAHLFCLGAFLLYLAFNSSMGTHLAPDQARLIWGGMATLWGPRHLLYIVPLLAVGVAALDWRRWRIACVGALAVSCAINLVGTTFSHTVMERTGEANQIASPPAHVFGLLFSDGPRLTLLDSHGVPAWIQLALWLALVAAWLVLLRSALAKDALSDEASQAMQ